MHVLTAGAPNRRATLRVAVVFAMLALVASALTGFSSPAKAAVPDQQVSQPAAMSQQQLPRYYFGAISLAFRGGAVGYSYDYRTKRAALRALYRKCRSASSYPGSCRKIVWVRNGCAALAVRWQGSNIARYGWGVARTRRAAYRTALNKCGARCVKRVYVCTTRP